MSMSIRDAAERVLHLHYMTSGPSFCVDTNHANDVAEAWAALRTALAAPEAEPVAEIVGWLHQWDDGAVHEFYRDKGDADYARAKYNDGVILPLCVAAPAERQGVPREPTEAMLRCMRYVPPLGAHGAPMLSEDIATEIWRAGYDAAPKGEVERNAARWDALANIWSHATELSLTQDEDGRWSITIIEAVENTIGKWTGDDPDDAIDAALAERKEG